MKTVETFIRSILGSLQLEYSELEESCPEILAEITEDWNKSGIYQISNSIDDRVYIGSTNSLRDRYRHHKRQLIKGNNPSILLQRFASKYGVNTLTFTVLEIVEDGKLLEREEYYLNLFNCKFNAMLTPLRQKGYKHTSETVEKMKKIAQDAFKKGRVSWNKGIKMTEEQKFSHKDCSKGIPRIANRTKIYEYTIDGIFIREWDSIRIASETLKIGYSSINQVLSGMRNSVYNKIFKYKQT